MTGTEKKSICDFIRISETYFLGYPPLEDSLSNLSFSDDVLIQTEEKISPLESLDKKIKQCQNCRLCQHRTNTVLGEGVSHPLVLVVGEGPGEQEDKTGRPFVGPAGELLDRMLSAIDLSRNTNCYIANIVKCRPPANRTPYPDEMQSCSAFLEMQIHILKPKVILAMGSTAVKALLNTSQGITKLRGQFFEYNTIPLTATYHPSALLHDQSLKAPAWADLKNLRSWLTEHFPDYKSKSGI